MVGILGIQTIGKHEEEGYKRYTIEQQGTMTNNVIPPVIVICEDKLAETILRHIDDWLNIKIIRAGSWNNLTTLLYGIGLYKKYSSAHNQLDVICVIDGDIPKGNILQRIQQTHSGSFSENNQELKEILDGLNTQIVSFSLSEINNSIIGNPEFNHKKWLEEISDDDIDKRFNGQLDELSKLRKSCISSEQQASIDINILHIKKEIEETKRIIHASRCIQFQYKGRKIKEDRNYKYGKKLIIISTQKVDYHNFYKRLSHSLQKGDTFRKYQINKTDNIQTRLDEIQWAVFKIIKTYNVEQWHKYIANVKDKILLASQNHQSRFSKDYFNGQEL